MFFRSKIRFSYHLYPGRFWISSWILWFRSFFQKPFSTELKSKNKQCKGSCVVVEVGPRNSIKARSNTGKFGVELRFSPLESPGGTWKETGDCDQTVFCNHCGTMLSTPHRNSQSSPISPDSIPATPGKIKLEKTFFARPAPRWGNICVSYHWLFSVGTFLLGLALLLSNSMNDHSAVYPRLGFDIMAQQKSMLWGGEDWEMKVRLSAHPKKPSRPVVLVTGAAGFVGSHLALALKKRGDGVVGLDNFNSYYDPNLKRDRQENLRQHNIFIVEGDINDPQLLAKLFDLVKFTHVAHLAAQAGVRYALENPSSYIHSNVAGWVNLLEACKMAVPQPAIVWASSSSVYGLNTKVPFSEKDRTDQPASLYAATKKAGEEIAHTYNHIYGLSLTALRFFTVYGPWGRPDMAYFSFTRNILEGKTINIFQGPNRVSVHSLSIFLRGSISPFVISADGSCKRFYLH